MKFDTLQEYYDYVAKKEKKEAPKVETKEAPRKRNVQKKTNAVK